MSGAASNDVVTRIVGFLRAIGIAVRAEPIAGETFLPGITIDHGTLVYDPARLAHPGDLLHEAGHIAVAPPARRAAFDRDAGDSPPEEMMAIAWSYAAALHIAVDPAIVFHEAGYRGGGGYILENFSAGHFFGVPMLEYAGMTLDRKRAAHGGVAPFPHMLCWLRGEPESNLARQE